MPVGPSDLINRLALANLRIYENHRYDPPHDFRHGLLSSRSVRLTLGHTLRRMELTAEARFAWNQISSSC
jgi:hypothetical protein